MMSIADETTAFITAALDFDHTVAALKVSGTTPESLVATIPAGRKAPYDLPLAGGVRKMPSPSFSREVLVELVVRMQRRRWQRFDDFVLGMSPPPDDGWQLIYAVLGVHPECGAGWNDLVLAAAHWIVETGGDPATGQLKEKYGELRWYDDGLAGELGDEIIAAAEHLSEFVCEVCGALGKCNRKGWMKTRCAEHEHE